MNEISIYFLFVLAASILLQLWLEKRHVNYVGKHRRQIPTDFQDQITLDEHQKAADYTIAKSKSGVIELFYSSLLLVLWTLGGGLDLLDNLWTQSDLGNLMTGVGVIISAFLLMSLLDLPVSIYHTFKLEARFGFNRTTPATFISDLFKQTALTLVISIPLVSLILWLMQVSGELWWLYVWGVWMSFSLLMMWAYPAFIAPLFNKFNPLDNPELEERISKLLKRCGFTSNGIFVMDGSTRSGHGNAYFTGLGKNKRIVFFDTLLESLEGEEVEAVLAHELGHFKRKHIQKQIVSMAIISLSGLALLGWLMQQPLFYSGLGVSQPSTYIALLLFMMVAPLTSIVLHPLMSLLSRRYEFEADEYAATQTDSRHLITALVKLYKENASTLTPDPLYSAFHDSHPPAPVRIAHLARITRAS
ncbi:MAG: M48 family metallopeptidase [Gammaproteobacteria bacterium]|nr:M48 family metallopeptidase [Gammaproteobacteria bacterium]